MSEYTEGRAFDFSIPFDDLTPAEQARRRTFTLFMIGYEFQRLQEDWRDATPPEEPAKPRKWGISNAATRGKSERKAGGAT